jgi:hypothetical protein
MMRSTAQAQAAFYSYAYSEPAGFRAATEPDALPLNFLKTADAAEAAVGSHRAGCPSVFPGNRTHSNLLSTTMPVRETEPARLYLRDLEEA